MIAGGGSVMIAGGARVTIAGRQGDDRRGGQGNDRGRLAQHGVRGEGRQPGLAERVDPHDPPVAARRGGPGQVILRDGGPRHEAVIAHLGRGAAVGIREDVAVRRAPQVVGLHVGGQQAGRAAAIDAHPDVRAGRGIAVHGHAPPAVDEARLVEDRAGIGEDRVAGGGLAAILHRIEQVARPFQEAGGQRRQLIHPDRLAVGQVEVQAGFAIRPGDVQVTGGRVPHQAVVFGRAFRAPAHRVEGHQRRIVDRHEGQHAPVVIPQGDHLRRVDAELAQDRAGVHLHDDHFPGRARIAAGVELVIQDAEGQAGAILAEAVTGQRAAIDRAAGDVRRDVRTTVDVVDAHAGVVRVVDQAGRQQGTIPRDRHVIRVARRARWQRKSQGRRRRAVREDVDELAAVRVVDPGRPRSARRHRRRGR